MSNRNSNNKSNSSAARTSTSTRQSSSTSTNRRIEVAATNTTNRAASSTRSQVSTAAVTSTAASTTIRSREPMTIRVRTTGEQIERVPVERSGYRVVRYEGRYHTLRGGGRTAPYIVGAEDGEDSLGRA